MAVEDLPKRGPLILNVNDQPVARYLASKMLMQAGYTVIEAASGYEALERTRSEDPDVVVLDVRLPDLDGFEVCRRIKADPALAEIKIMHTSATYVTSDSRVQGLTAGADAYLAQPFESTELIATVQSLIRLRRAEQELRVRAERLAENDRRKDEFIAMLAHELRNPLSAMSMALPFFERHPARDPEETFARQVLARQTSHLVHMVDDLLDVARVTRGVLKLRREIFDLTVFLERISKLQAQSREDGGRRILFENRAAEPVYVDADRTRLEQVISNLVDNSRRHTQQCDEIEVRLEKNETERRCTITVIDRGRGIEAKSLPLIFGAFYQARSKHERPTQGLGLGLAIVKAIVELHGGDVRVESDGLGQGTRVLVDLPLADRVPTPVESGGTELVDEERLEIVLVEDNPDVGKMLCNLLESWGHRVSLAPDGVSGVERIRAQRPPVAIVDIGLPGIDGLELARRIRADEGTRGVRLLALTGYGTDTDREACLDAGFDAHMVKPPNAQELRRLLQRPATRTKSPA